MAFSTGGRGPFSGQMNVTPLIDVLLVLIIMFMVVESMSKEYVTPAQIPEPAPKGMDTHSDENTIVIQVEWDKDNQKPAIKINKESVAMDDLAKRLHVIYLGRLQKIAYVKGDDDLDFQYVAQVIAEAHNGGIDRVGLLTNQNF